MGTEDLWASLVIHLNFIVMRNFLRKILLDNFLCKDRLISQIQLLAICSSAIAGETKICHSPVAGSMNTHHCMRK
jgi:hypothetical protein